MHNNNVFLMHVLFYTKVNNVYYARVYNYVFMHVYVFITFDYLNTHPLQLHSIKKQTKVDGIIYRKKQNTKMTIKMIGRWVGGEGGNGSSC